MFCNAQFYSKDKLCERERAVLPIALLNEPKAHNRKIPTFSIRKFNNHIGFKINLLPCIPGVSHTSQVEWQGGRGQQGGGGQQEEGKPAT